jgi:hypothetical protein
MRIESDNPGSVQRPPASVASAPLGRVLDQVTQRLANVLQMPCVSELVHQLRAASDPLLTRAAVEYREQAGELFGANGPSVSDIEQAWLADCYFLSAVGAVVARDPQEIRDMIRDNRDGTYTVTFYAQRQFARAPVSVMVDDDLPVDANGDLVYAHASDSDGDAQLELWVPLLEKAYAKFRDHYGPADGVNGYHDMDQGGWPNEVMEDLTGEPASRSSSFFTPAELLGLLEPANTGHLVCIATLEHGTDPGWVDGHAYTVVGTEERNGQTLVTLKNPWGNTVPQGATPLGLGDAGAFTVSLSDVWQNTASVQSTD